MKFNYFPFQILLIILAFLSPKLYSQSNHGFTYQAVARENDALLENSELELMIQLLEGGEEGILLWEESHNEISNAYGMFSLIVGDGISTGQGESSTFNEVDWSSGNIFLKVLVRKSGETSWTSYAAEKIQAVPYALHSLNSGSSDGWSVLDGNLVYSSGRVGIGTDTPGSRFTVQGVDEAGNEPLFMVTRKDGYPVFAVYEDGVYAYTDTIDSGKGRKGGFAVGGYNAGKKGTVQDYMRITADSIRFYITESEAKGVKGGFAVGGYNASKAGTSEILTVTSDSTRINVTNSRAGFSVGDLSAGGDVSFMQLTPENYFIGHESGRSITSGQFNSYLGYQAGRSTSSANGNTFLGYQSGMNNTEGGDNLFLGPRSGFQNTTGTANVFLGKFAGYSNVSGETNVFVGTNAGYSNMDGEANVYIGSNAGAASNSFFNVFIGNESGRVAESASNVFIGGTTGPNVTVGGFNTLVGASAGLSMTTAAYSTIIGAEAGRYGNGESNVFVGTWAGDNSDGDGNVYVGQSAGNYNDGALNIILGMASGLNSNGNSNIYIGSFAASNTSGSHNIFIGTNAGENYSGTNKLIIENSNAENPLLFGDFEQDKLVINASLNYGNALGTNAYSVTIPSITTYLEGMALYLKFQNANTGNTTVNVNGLGSTPVLSSDGSQLFAGAVKSGGIHMLIYNGTAFQLISY